MASYESVVQGLSNVYAYFPLVAKTDSGLWSMGADFGPNLQHGIEHSNLAAITGPFSGERVVTGDGSSAVIRLPDAFGSGLDGAASITVAGYHKHARGNGYRAWLYVPNSTDENAMIVGVDINNYLFGNMRPATGESARTGNSSSTQIADDTWEFFCVIFNIGSDQIRTRLGNGSLKTSAASFTATTAAIGSAAATTSKPRLLARNEGGSPPLDAWSDGGLAHVVIVKDELDSTALNALYGADAGLDTGAVVGTNSAAISLTMYDRSGGLVTSRTGLQWAWFDSPNPSTFDAPADSGSDGEIDGSGVLSITATTTLDTGTRVGFLLVSDTDGDPDEQSFAHAAPVTVTVT